MMRIDEGKGRCKGNKGDPVIRALASHQCGPGANPDVYVDVDGLSLFLVLFLVFLLVQRFSPRLKNQHFQIPIRSGTHGHV